MSYSCKSGAWSRPLAAIVFLLACPVFLTLGVSGCKKPEAAFGKDVLATVNGQPLTVAEFTAWVGKPPDKPEQREAALMQVIDKKLISDLAVSEGMLAAPAVFSGLESFYIERLPDFLCKRLIEEAVVSDDELAVPRKALKPIFQVSMVVVSTMAEAESALADLKKGASFKDVSEKYSTVRGDTEKQISLDDDLYPVGVRAVLNRLTPGSLSPAMKIELGYVICKLNSRITADDMWKQQVERRRAELKEKKGDKEMEELLARLRSKARIKVEKRTLPNGEVRYYGAEVNGITIKVDPSMYDAPPSPHTTHEGLNTQTIKFMLYKRVDGLLLSQEARERGVQYDPEFQKLFQMEKTGLLFQNYIDKIRGGGDITPQEMQDYYNKNKDKLAFGASVRVSRILLPTQEAAQAALMALKSGKDFGALARKVSTDKESGGRGGDVGYVMPDKLQDPAKSALSKMKPGDISGVLKTEYGFEILKVTDRKEGGVPAMSAITSVLRSKVMLVKNSERVEAFYKSLHEKADIKINKQLLNSL